MAEIYSVNDWKKIFAGVVHKLESSRPTDVAVAESYNKIIEACKKAEISETSEGLAIVSIPAKLRREISKHLSTYGDDGKKVSLIADRDIQYPDKLVSAISKYVKAAEKTMDVQASIIEHNETTLKETKTKLGSVARNRDELVGQKNALMNDNYALNAKLKKQKKFTIGTSVAAGLATAGLVASLAFGKGKQQPDYSDKNPDKDSAAYAELLEDYTDLEGKYSALQGSYATLENNYNSLMGEIDEVKGIISSNGGATTGNDVSSALENVINGIQKEDGVSQAHVDEVYKHIAGALGVEEDSLKDNGNFSTTKINKAIKDALANAEKEDGINQTHVDGVYKAVASTLGISEDELKTDGHFDSGKMGAAIKNAINAAVNEDGVHQSHVDEVYQTIAEIFKDYGITEDKLKDDKGNFTTSKLSNSLKPIVETALTSAKTIESVTNTLNSVLDAICEDEVTVESLGSIDKAITYIKEHYVNSLDKLMSNFTTPSGVEFTTAQFTNVTKAVEWLDKTIEGLQTQYETANQNIANLEKQIGDLQNKINQNNNTTQNSPSASGSTSSGSAVGDKEPDENTSPNQSDKGNNQGSDESEPGF